MVNTSFIFSIVLLLYLPLFCATNAIKQFVNPVWLTPHVIGRHNECLIPKSKMHTFCEHNYRKTIYSKKFNICKNCDIKEAIHHWISYNFRSIKHIRSKIYYLQKIYCYKVQSCIFHYYLYAKSWSKLKSTTFRNT